MIVYVAPHKRLRGVRPPGESSRGCPAGGTYDWRHAPGSAENTRRVVAAYDRAQLAEALAASYSTDAHLVTGQLVGPDGQALERQPRICKSALDWLDAEGFHVECDLLFADVDHPDHAEWSPTLRHAFDALWQSPPPSLETVGVYLTAHGFRLVQPLDEPANAPDVERYLQSWLDEVSADLASTGTPWTECDPACKDWTRHFRLPHVRRGAAPYRSPLVDLSRLRPRAIHPKRFAGMCGAGALERLSA